MIETNSSSQFVDSLTQRFVRSWFNRQTVAFNSPALASSPGISASLSEITTAIRCQFLIWSDEVISTNTNATYFNNTSGAIVTIAIAYDTNADVSVVINGDGSGRVNPVPTSSAKQGLSEGYHYVTLQGSLTSGSASMYSASRIVAMIR